MSTASSGQQTMLPVWVSVPTDSDSKSVTESGFREVTPPAENEYPYRPCPANVEFPDGHHECLG
jgi:hypothetical protein